MSERINLRKDLPMQYTSLQYIKCIYIVCFYHSLVASVVVGKLKGTIDCWECHSPNGSSTKRCVLHNSLTCWWIHFEDAVLFCTFLLRRPRLHLVTTVQLGFNQLTKAIILVAFTISGNIDGKLSLRRLSYYQGLRKLEVN